MFLLTDIHHLQFWIDIDTRVRSFLMKLNRHLIFYDFESLGYVKKIIGFQHQLVSCRRSAICVSYVAINTQISFKDS